MPRRGRRRSAVTIVSCSALNTSSTRCGVRVEHGVLEGLCRAQQNDVVDFGRGEWLDGGSTGADRARAAGTVLAAGGDDGTERQGEPSSAEQLAPIERCPRRSSGHDDPSGRIGSAVLTSSTSRSSPRPERSAARCNGGPPSPASMRPAWRRRRWTIAPAARCGWQRRPTRGRTRRWRPRCDRHHEPRFQLVVQPVVAGIGGHSGKDAMPWANASC